MASCSLYASRDQMGWGPIAHYKGSQLPHTLAKLRTRQLLKIAAFGMSITRGMDVSSYDTVRSYLASVC